MRGVRIGHLLVAVAASALFFAAIRLDQGDMRCTPISPILAVLYLCGALGFHGARCQGRRGRIGLWLGLLLGPVGVVLACSNPIPKGWPRREADQYGRWRPRPADTGLPEIPARHPRSSARGPTALIAVVLATLPMSCADRDPLKQSREGRVEVKKKGPPSPHVVAPAVRSGPSASTKVGNQEILATVADDARTVLISIAGVGRLGTIDLPSAAGRVTELRICPWTRERPSGVALAIEMKDEETGMFSYHWATAWSHDSEMPHNVFLESKVDYRLVSVVNPPNEGDSIYVILTADWRRKTGDAKSGYLFIHHCPIGSPLRGSLYHLAPSPDEIPQSFESAPRDPPSSK